MKESEALELVATAMRMYPRQEYRDEPGTIRLYAEALLDLPYEEAVLALREHQATSQWFPSVAELRRLVAQRALDLPGPAESWLLLQQWLAQLGRTEPCEPCGGSGWPTGSDYPCTACRGEGAVPVEPAVPLSEPAKRALQVVGGSYALATAERPEVLRGQWMRAYTELRDELLRSRQVPWQLSAPADNVVELHAGT